MLNLFCVVIGEGSVFSVKIDADEAVDHLKKKIKEEKSQSIHCDADGLQLYLACKDDAWLKNDDAKAVTLDDLQGFKWMDNAALWIKNPAYFGANFQPNEGDIHVLVVVPEGAVVQSSKKQRQDVGLRFSLQDIQFVDPENCEENVWIDTRGIMNVTDFPEEYFIRKESIHVFNLLKARTKQIVLVGSPGVGKSLLLVLYSFWMAIEQKKCVLLVRQVKKEGLSMVLLNGQNLSESWKLEKLNAEELAPLV